MPDPLNRQPRRPLGSVLAEDATVFREGFVGILEKARHTVIAAVEDAEALQAYIPPRPARRGHRRHPDATDGVRHAGIGYLLEHCVGHVREFLDRLDRVSAGGTVVDLEVVSHLRARRRDDGPLAAPT